MSAVSAGVPQFRERLVKSKNRGDVLDQAQEYRNLIGAAWVLVTNQDGVLIARTDYPEEQDIDLSRGALIGNALSGEPASGAFIDDRNPSAIRLYVPTPTPLPPGKTAPHAFLDPPYPAHP